MFKKAVWGISFIICALLVNVANAAVHVNATQQGQSSLNFFWQSQSATDVYNVQIDAKKGLEAGFAIQVNNMPFIPGLNLSAVNVQWMSQGVAKSTIVKPGAVLMFHASDYVRISSVDGQPAEGMLTYLGAITVG